MTTTRSPAETLLSAVFGKDPANAPPRAILDEVLGTLQPREAQVLRLRFGLDDGVPKTLCHVALYFPRTCTSQRQCWSRATGWVTRTYPQGTPLSTERIHQIEAKALRKLRHHSRSNKLRPYLLGRVIPAEVYQIPIARLEISPRTLKCLRRADINTVGEILEKGKDELMTIWNFGEKSLQELYSALRAQDLLPEEESKA